MEWELANRADARCLPVADRHYNRQKVGSPQFMPLGSCCVFYAGQAGGGEAVWGTSAPYAQYVRHAWAGAWVCSIYRNEGLPGGINLVRDGVSATRAVLGSPPDLGMVTFVDARKVTPKRVRGQDVWGWTFLKAGFRHVGFTKGGLHAFQMLPAEMPEPVSPHGHQGTFYMRAA